MAAVGWSAAFRRTAERVQPAISSHSLAAIDRRQQAHCRPWLGEQQCLESTRCSHSKKEPLNGIIQHYNKQQINVSRI